MYTGMIWYLIDLILSPPFIHTTSFSSISSAWWNFLHNVRIITGNDLTNIITHLWYLLNVAIIMLAELEKQINLSVDMAETEKGTSSSVNPKKKDSLLGTPIFCVCRAIWVVGLVFLVLVFLVTMQSFNWCTFS